MTYWGLNAVFLAVVAVLVLLAARRLRLPAVAATLGILLLMTAVFDNIMIGIGLVDYEPTLISGAFLGIAPLEDFAYAIAAALLLPALWQLLPASRSRSAPASRRQDPEQ